MTKMKIYLRKIVPDGPLLLHLFGDTNAVNVDVRFRQADERGIVRTWKTQCPVPMEVAASREATQAYVEKLFYEKPQLRYWEMAGQAFEWLRKYPCVCPRSEMTWRKPNN